MGFDTRGLSKRYKMSGGLLQRRSMESAGKIRPETSAGLNHNGGREVERIQATTDFASLARSAHLLRARAGDGPSLAVSLAGRRFSLPNSKERVERLPFSPRGGGSTTGFCADGRPQTASGERWSPRAAAREVADCVYELEAETHVKQRLQEMVKLDLERNPLPPVRAITHHIQIDQDKVKRSTSACELLSVTGVARRSQRALSTEEVLENCQKSIDFFSRNAETNETVRQSSKGRSLSKLRQKFMIAIRLNAGERSLGAH